MSRGSEWRKWDLHIHSPFSILNNGYPNLPGGEPYWEKFIKKLEDSGLAVVGITDYFTIDGYKKVREYKEAGRLKDVTVFPNIEFRLDNVLSSKKDGEDPRRLNFHVIFSDEVDPKDIEEHFLHDLSFHFEGTPQSEDENRKLKVSNIKALGEKLISEHDYFKDSGQDALQIGATTTVVDHAEISRILSGDSRFRDKYLIVFPEELSNLVDWDGQDHNVRKVILQKSDAVFSSNSKTREWCLGKKPYKEGKDKFIEEFKSLKPCIHGCDAHRIEDIGRPCAKRGDKTHICETEPEKCELRYCWIKADPTFLGLKQIIYEPDERVRIQEECPEPRKNIYSLKSVEFFNGKIDKDLEITQQEIPLNANLVAVIGGKGSGKTALLDLIANCFEDRCERGKNTDKNSFVRRIEGQGNSLKTALSFIGHEDTYLKELTDDDFFQLSKVTYLPQAKSEEYIGNQEKLHEKIKEIIFKQEEIKSAEFQAEFDTVADEIKASAKLITDTNFAIHNLEQDVKTEVVDEITKKKRVKEGELKNKEEELRVLLERMGDDDKKSVEELKGKEKELRAIHSRLVTTRNSMQTLTNQIDEFLGANSNIDGINKELLDLKISATIPHIDLSPQTKAISKAVMLVNKAVLKVEEEISRVNKIVEQLSDAAKAHAKLLLEIDGIRKEIAALEEQLKGIDLKKKQIDQLMKDQKKTYHTLIKRYFAHRKLYEKVISTFSKGKDAILSNIDFRANIIFDAKHFIELGDDIFNSRSLPVSQIEQASKYLDKLISAVDLKKADQHIDEYINEVLKFKSFMKKTRTSQNFYDWVFGSYFSLNTEILFDGVHIDKLSMGQKGTVLLKIFLAEGESPLIIDQPEENLDNDFVYKALVDAFREAKKKRQIIIATHNANLVVNTDAEQVIVSTFKDGKISYKSGSIENPKIKKDITDFLEGGDVAFKKREMKYNIKSLIAQ